MITPFSQKMVEAWNSGNEEDIGEMYASDVQVLHSMVPTSLNAGTPSFNSREACSPPSRRFIGRRRVW
jgi:hypothetical protein